MTSTAARSGRASDRRGAAAGACPPQARPGARRSGLPAGPLPCPGLARPPFRQPLAAPALVSPPCGFLVSPGWAYFPLLTPNVGVGVPFSTFLLPGARQDVPAELKEAAMLDGASAWQRLTRVTLPIIRPVIEVV